MAYKQETEIKYNKKTEDLLEYLPPFMSDYYDYITLHVSASTLYGYVRDLKDYLLYLSDALGKPVKNITEKDIEGLSSLQITKYLTYLRYYEKDGRVYQNTNLSIRRKLSSIKSLHSVLFIQDKIAADQTVKIKSPKVEEHEIIRMDEQETKKMMDAVQFGETLSKKQMDYHNIYGYRDFTLMSVLLYTGIRVSECVGLDMRDIDLENHRMRVIRKGGSDGIIYYSDELTEILSDYITLFRKKQEAKSEKDEDAMFLSSQKKRMTVRNVQYMVKKYAANAEMIKHITPHKFRSTYGSALYDKTKDLLLTSAALGHKNIQTAKDHYVKPTDTLKDKRNEIKF